MTRPGVFGGDHVPLLTAAEAAALDRRAEDEGLAGRTLMENAGRAAAQVVDRLYPRGRVVAAVGGGHNGGDALVAIRSLHEWGRPVGWIQAGSRPPDLSLLNGLDLPAAPAPVASAALAAADVLIDGILGTGSSGPPRDPAAGLIRALNASRRPIVALDIPSGVDPTTGEVPGEAVDAAATIMFGFPKTGGLIGPGRVRCGRIVVVEIGFPAVREGEAGSALITPGWAAARLPRRAPDTHKNAVGRVTIIAGRKGMAGAAAIAGRAAVRAGAGMVRLVSDEVNRVVLQSRVPESLFIDRADADAVGGAVESADAVLIGPGIGTDEEAEALLDRVLEALDGRGCVLDADALTLLAARPGGIDRLGGDHRDERDTRDAAADPPGSPGPGAGRLRFVLTPHPGEMSRITDLAVDEIRSDPMDAARSLAQRTGAAVLLKGLPSVVAAPGAPVLVSAVGSSDLAAAGMGDHLGGVVAAMLAAGAAPGDAAALGLFYSGRASELASRGRSLTPDDIADRLHRAFRRPGPRRSSLRLPFVLFDQPPRW